ncbi:MAG: CHASE domain-containing protein [Kiritimatiellae bacterium]|nr:CHASE domain-containing protein [Kiritimatiellia bacterium]
MTAPAAPTPSPSVPAAPAPRRARRQAAAAVILLAAGLLLTLLLALDLAHRARRAAYRDFLAEADGARARAARELQLYLDVFDSIRRLHGLSDRVTPEAFAEIAQKGMLHQQRVLGAYGFAQILPEADRAAAERQGSPIVENDGRGGYVPAPSRPAYFLLTYQTPPSGLGVPTGYDFGSDPAAHGALSEMFRHAIFTVAPTPDPGAFLLFAPTLYLADPAAPAPVPSGFAVALFSPARLLAPVAGDLRRTAIALLPPSPAAEARRAAAGLSAPAGTRWLTAFPVAIGQQEWLFCAESAPSFWLPKLPRTPLLAAALGVLLSLGLFLWLWGASRQTAQVERLVRRRTAQLADANRRLGDLMEERCQLEESVLRIGREERTRVGRDLHDSLGQKLTGALYLFTAWSRRHAPPGDPDAAQIASTLKDAVTQVRRIARGLAPVALTEDGLPDALRALASEASALYPLDVDFYYEREGRPRDAAAAEHLYLIAQEAVTNAAKHSGGTRVVLTLDFPPEGGLLAIEDDGRGMAAADAPDAVGGNGLRIMRHRADILGGTLSFETSPATGTRIAVSFPAAPA